MKKWPSGVENCLPDPFGPIIAVNRCRGPITILLRYDLKFSISMNLRKALMVR